MLFYGVLLTGSFNSVLTAWAQAIGGNILLEVYYFGCLQQNLDRYVEQLHFKASQNNSCPAVLLFKADLRTRDRGSS